MTNLDAIKDLLSQNKTEEAIAQLLAYITENDKDDEAFFVLGNAYRKFNDWKHAMSAYCQAMELNPESPAKDAYLQTKEILDFYHHDLYNP